MEVNNPDDLGSLSRLTLDDTESPTPPPNLHFFSRLPTEIQLQIFRTLAYIPRTVKIVDKYDEDEDAGDYSAHSFWPDRLISPEPVPAVLQICHASRQEAIGLYTKAFQTIQYPDVPTGNGSVALSSVDGHVWVNYQVDTLKMSYDALYHVPVTETARFRRLILDIDYLYSSVSDYRKLFAPMDKLVSLDIVSVEHGLDHWSGWVDKFWDMFEDLFGGREGWKHPEVRIIEQKTGDVMTCLNEERLFDRFARESWAERIRAERGEHCSMPQWISIQMHDRRRPVDPREEPVESNYPGA